MQQFSVLHIHAKYNIENVPAMKCYRTHSRWLAIWFLTLSLLGHRANVSSLQFFGSGKNKNNKDAISFLKQAKSDNIQAAVLVPGFLTGADEFKGLCETLTKGGLPTVAVPMPNWHWIACLVSIVDCALLEGWNQNCFQL